MYIYPCRFLYTALNELELFKDKEDGKYPKIYKSWHDNLATLSTYFKYPEAVRQLIYTTNVIEGFSRRLRKVTKSKTIFPTDDSLLKILYLAIPSGLGGQIRSQQKNLYNTGKGRTIAIDSALK